MKRKNSLFVWDAQVLYAAWEETTTMHSLYSASLCFSLDLPSKLFLSDGNPVEYTGVLLPPNTSYYQVSKNTYIINIYIDPDSFLFDRLSGNIKDGVQFFDSTKIPYLGKILDILLNENSPNEEVLGCLKLLVDSVFGSILPLKTPEVFDPRIFTVAKHLRSLTYLPQPEEVKLKNLANIVNLSEDRFRHVFKETLLTSVRKFILSLRLKIAARNFFTSANFTEIAHLAGFSDSAHFSRTFRSAYGHSPSAVFRNSKRTRIRFIKSET
ncbi:helix-turn-helix domain-containing protein [Leptospira sp. 96542]|nr:helix-turn-helix domain-containing protein [Leptospira sp. 96542]